MLSFDKDNELSLGGLLTAPRAPAVASPTAGLRRARNCHAAQDRALYAREEAGRAAGIQLDEMPAAAQGRLSI